MVRIQDNRQFPLGIDITTSAKEGGKQYRGAKQCGLEVPVHTRAQTTARREIQSEPLGLCEVQTRESLRELERRERKGRGLVSWPRGRCSRKCRGRTREAGAARQGLPRGTPLTRLIERRGARAVESCFGATAHKPPTCYQLR